MVSLLFNMLSRSVITFLPRSKWLLISPSTVTVYSDFGAQENIICHCFRFSPSICYEVMGLDAMILIFLMLSFKPALSLNKIHTHTPYIHMYMAITHKTMGKVNYMSLVLYISRNWLMLLSNLKKKTTRFLKIHRYYYNIFSIILSTLLNSNRINTCW